MKCPKCKSEMVEVEHEEQKRIKSATREHIVTPYACPDCGFIEEYAEVN